MGKKEECWLMVKGNKWSYNIADINADCIDENNPPKRIHKVDVESGEADVDIRKKFLNRYRFLFGKRLKNGDEIQEY